MNPAKSKRRRYLAVCGAITAGALAGCLDRSDDPDWSSLDPISCSYVNETNEPRSVDFRVRVDQIDVVDLGLSIPSDSSKVFARITHPGEWEARAAAKDHHVTKSFEFPASVFKEGRTSVLLFIESDGLSLRVEVED